MSPRTLLFLLAMVSPAMAKPGNYLEKPVNWFSSEEGKLITSRILSWQTPRGDWPKNHDDTLDAHEGDRGKLTGTFDNSATTDELRFLAKAHEATKDAACRDAFLLGLDHILAAQYENGGWPQCSPAKGYQKNITFNDGTMVRLLEFLREVSSGKGYGFVDPVRRDASSKAFGKGIGCILRCQIVINGVATVWCAQHDEVTFQPAKARAYELPSLSGSESAGILRFLMSLEKPSPEVIKAVNAGADWFESSRLRGIRVTDSGGDKKVVADETAPPLWARFYDLETGKPFFCGRDGVKKSDLSEIEAERRNGYSWYGNWGESVARIRAKWRPG